MNRIVLFGLSCFFALIGIGLIGGPTKAQAFHGWQFYGCCGCQGWHPGHQNQRCYSGSGCSGCCGGYGVGQCCSSSCCGGSSCYQRCYGCYGCQGAIHCSCQGCYGNCFGCGGYYQSAVPIIVVPMEPAPAANPPASSADQQTTLQVVPTKASEFRSFTDANPISFASDSVEAPAFDPYIHEPR